jgi:alanine-glyoxylate transaminase/serine-glyoxylate transaminase/serine-pyruvate transaminase
MQNYEAKKASYFATPSPQLIHALHTSLSQILARPLSERFAAHRAASQKVKKAIGDLGLKQLAADPADQANGTAPELLPNLLNKGVILAGGLHKSIATKYFRVGHMGVSVVSTSFPRTYFSVVDAF